MFGRLVATWRNKRRLMRLKKAVALVEAAGYTVCQIEYWGNVAYIVDENGAWRKIGKRA